MKKMLMLLMFIIVLSGTAFSKTVYLVIPDDATDVKYYAIDSDGSYTGTISDNSKKKKYHGDEDLNFATLSVGSSKIIKLVVGYKLDDEYYFLASEDADSNDADDLNNFYDGGTVSWSYSTSPGIKIKDDVRLSMIPVEKTGLENFEKITTADTVEVKGTSGVNPANSEENELVFSYYDENDKLQTVEFKSGDEIYSIKNTKFQPSSTNTLKYSNVTELKFKAKNGGDIPQTLTIGGTTVKNEKYTLTEGNMTVEFYNSQFETKESKKNYGLATGKWGMIIDGTAKDGTNKIIYLLTDTGVTAESGIDVESTVNSKSRKRETRLETSILDDSDNFVIENIKE